MSRKSWSIIVMLFCFASGSQAKELDYRNALGDPSMVKVFANFMRLSGSRPDDLEHAAFVIRDGEGRLTCKQWPYANLQRQRVYRGVIPEGTVAIVHTHTGRSSQPSASDITQSIRSGLPLYVLTIGNIYVVDPQSGEKMQLVDKQDWSRGISATADGRCTQMTSWN